MVMESHTHVFMLVSHFIWQFLSIRKDRCKTHYGLKKLWFFFQFTAIGKRNGTFSYLIFLMPYGKTLHSNGFLGALCNPNAMDPHGGGFHSCSFNIGSPWHMWICNFAEVGFWFNGLKSLCQCVWDRVAGGRVPMQDIMDLESLLPCSIIKY